MARKIAKGEVKPKEVLNNVNPFTQKQREEAALKKAQDDAMA